MVIKRDGRKEEWDVEKIRKQINPACKGTDINPLELESLLQLGSNTNITASDIQEKLIITAKNQVNLDNPDWNLVAGRLSSYQLSREVWKNTKVDFKDFKEHVEYLVRNGYYRADLTQMYTPDELTLLSKYLKDDRDYNLLLSQVMLLKSKYLIKNKRGTLEYPSTADMVNSMILASNEKDKLKYTKIYYDLLSTYVISLATPFKSNLRLPDGNVGSCFVGESPDNLNGIMKSYNDMAVISKEGGGVGWYFGKVRPSGCYTPQVPKANNITKWVKIVNDIAVAVNQRGIRKGAITPALDWWHLDIISFIEMKSELNGDLRDKCFDVFPQVVVDDYFIQKVIDKETVYLYDQYEYKKLTGKDITELVGDDLFACHVEAHTLITSGKLKHFKEVKANSLWRQFLETWIEYGDFYITHKDNLNISNYLSTFGVAKCSNLCVESFSLTRPATSWKTEVSGDSYKTVDSDAYIHSCNLVSINVANILNDDELLKKACYSAVRILDSSIDLGTMPIYEAQKSSEFLRNIGIGVVGMADYMAYNGAMYDTEEGIMVGEKLYETIAWYCYNASIALAKDKGSYAGIVHADYSTLFGKEISLLNTYSKINGNNYDWGKVQADIREHGIRNMLLLASAPNTSSALVQGVTASYLPAHAKDSTQKLGDMICPVLPKFIKSRPLAYKTKFMYKVQDLIRYTRHMQRWVDTGMSMECPINTKNTTIKQISDEILDGFMSKELKAVYYSITVDGDRIPCEGCAN